MSILDRQVVCYFKLPESLVYGPYLTKCGRDDDVDELETLEILIRPESISIVFTFVLF